MMKRILTLAVFIPPSCAFKIASMRNVRSTRLFSFTLFAEDLLKQLPTVSEDVKRVFWVRHGEVINPGGDRPVYYGAQDVELSELGQAEARAAGDFLSNFDLSMVFCSPLKRAVYGAQQVLASQKSEEVPIQLEGFKELDRGAWCGLTKAEIGPDNLARFDACDESVTPEGGESYVELKTRVIEAKDEVVSRLKPGQAGCVVSHLQVTRSILSEALTIPTEKMADIKIATASITCVDYYDQDKPSVVHFQSFKPESGLEQSKDGAN